MIAAVVSWIVGDAAGARTRLVRGDFRESHSQLKGRDGRVLETATIAAWRLEDAEKDSRHYLQHARPFMVPRSEAALFKYDADPFFHPPRNAAVHVASAAPEFRRGVNSPNDRRPLSKGALAGSINSHASKPRQLRLQPRDEQSASAALPQLRQSASGLCHSSLERNCPRREP